MTEWEKTKIIDLYIMLFELKIYRYFVMRIGLFILVKGFAISRSVGISNSDARNDHLQTQLPFTFTLTVKIYSKKTDVNQVQR